MRTTVAAGLLLAALCVLGCDNSPSKARPRPSRALVPTIDEPAPDIIGEDLDGKVFKLSDYRGKVVMLDFWGMWCMPCKMFLPHGKKLLETYKGRPFVPLGVNTDEDPSLPRSSKSLAMRCWSDPAMGAGPICRSWGIRMFPTVYLIDHEGVVRNMFAGFPLIGKSLDTSSLDAAIERLVKKAEEKKVASSK